MKTKFILSLFVFTSLLLTSCSSDDGESTGTSTGNYWPMAVNNSWIFDNNGVNEETKITGTSTFSGKTYYRLNDVYTSGVYVKNWVAKKGATYFQRVDDVNVNEQGVSIYFKSYEIPIFRDDLNVNQQWSGTVKTKITYTYNGQSTSPSSRIEYTGTVLEKNASVTLNGNTYNDVIKVRLTVKVVIDTQITTTTSEYWFANEVGPIREYTNDSGDISEQTLISYTLY
ncbi:hypothetical protein GCM10011508_05570 [Flavobacterium lutivivi]|nr:hypothetical protein GCM10011508_05570 [Flavobacterium lutivivi]